MATIIIHTRDAISQEEVDRRKAEITKLIVEMRQMEKDLNLRKMLIRTMTEELRAAMNRK